MICQEVGHIFRLAHQDETFDNANLGTRMDYTDYPEGGGTGGALSNLHPNQHDYDQLDAVYGGENGGGGGPPDGKSKPSSPPGNGISQWGQAIGTDGNGRPDRFKLDLGGENKLFTHVIWAN